MEVFQEVILNGQKVMHQVNTWFSTNLFLIKFQLKSNDSFDGMCKLNENLECFFHVIIMIAQTEKNKIMFHHTEY